MLRPRSLNPHTVPLLGYPKIVPSFPCTKFEMTNKQIDSKILPTPTNIVGMYNKNLCTSSNVLSLLSSHILQGVRLIFLTHVVDARTF